MKTLRMRDFGLSPSDLPLVENVGDRVCTAAVDLGQHENVRRLAVAKRDDKSVKCPLTFGKTDHVLLFRFEPLDALGNLRLEIDTSNQCGLLNRAFVSCVSASPCARWSWSNRWIDGQFLFRPLQRCATASLE